MSVPAIASLRRRRQRVSWRKRERRGERRVKSQDALTKPTAHRATQCHSNNFQDNELFSNLIWRRIYYLLFEKVAFGCKQTNE